MNIEKVPQKEEIKEEESKVPKIKKIYHHLKKTRTLFRQNMEVEDLIYAGKYQNFDAIESLLEEMYLQELSISQPSKYSVLMSDPTIHNKKSRQKICEMMFEKFNVKGYFVVKKAVLQAFSIGRQTCCLFDSGATRSLVVSIHDGFALQKSILVSKMAGEYLTNQLLQHIENDLKVNITPEFELERIFNEDGTFQINRLQRENVTESLKKFGKMSIARRLKQEFLEVEHSGEIEQSKKQEIQDGKFQLPDGTSLTLSKDLKYSLTAPFFDKNKFNVDIKDAQKYEGLSKLILKCLKQAPSELNQILKQNIIITGGNSLLKGFYKRMEENLRESLKGRVNIYQTIRPDKILECCSAFIGGSILGSLTAFQEMFITKQDYENHGSYVIEKKCP